MTRNDPATPAAGEPGDGTAAADPQAASTQTADAAPAGRPGADERPAVEGYEVLAEVGRGGMGVVYKARSHALDRLVALKVIRRERLLSPEAVHRFRREAQAAARLSHPNIVVVHDSDHEGDTHFLAMEYVDGVTLQRLVEENGPLPVGQACDFMRQAALGLQHAFEQALVHRDIKPTNLMVVARGAARATHLVKILDMGVARLYQLSGLSEDSLTTLTQDGAVVGTPDYIAPEQLEDAHGADIRADLYSLGCTFYFLLTGRVPFPGGTLIQKLDRQRWETPPSVEQLRPEVPQGVAAVVRKLMAKAPADRYQTPAELAADLEELSRTGHVPSELRSARLREARRLAGHAGAVWDVAFTPDGRTAVSAGKDGTVRLWDVGAGAELRRLLLTNQEIRFIAIAPDGGRILAGAGATPRLLDLATGEELGRCVGHTAAVRGAAFAPDGLLALSGGEDRTVRLWDVQTCQELRRFAGHRGDVHGVAVSPDGRLAVSAGRDHTLRLWDVQEGEELERFPRQGGPVWAVAFAPDGRSVLCGGFDTTLRLWDVAGGRELRRFQGHRHMVAAVAFAPEGGRALSGSHDRTVRLWDLDSGHELCRCEGHGGTVTCVAFAPDGRQVLTGDSDGVLCLWQLPE